jgi:uncharacterized phage protein (TIGR01671 family)
MRDIKFRGWKGCKRVDNFCVGTNLFGVSATVCDVYDKWSHIELDCIEQFTGLLDSNGVEIYEGDIVSDGCRQNDHCISGVHVVELRDGAFSPFAVPGWEGTMSVDKCQVIGNIHQNPEVLK